MSDRFQNKEPFETTCAENRNVRVIRGYPIVQVRAETRSHIQVFETTHAEGMTGCSVGIFCSPLSFVRILQTSRTRMLGLSLRP